VSELGHYSNPLILAPDNINDEHKMPRGIRGYQLLSDSDFTEWRIAGSESSFCELSEADHRADIGGENAPDAVRGPYNEVN
jgi:hypothetical protein